MCAYPVDGQQAEREKYPAFQLCYSEYILETIDNTHDDIILQWKTGCVLITWIILILC